MSDIMGKRFKAIRDALDISTEEFGKRINISPAYVNLIENGHRKPSDRIITALFSELGIARGWWETGEGKIFADRGGSLQKSLMSEEVELINLWRVLDEDDQSVVINLVKMLARRHIKMNTD